MSNPDLQRNEARCAVQEMTIACAAALDNLHKHTGRRGVWTTEDIDTKQKLASAIRTGDTYLRDWHDD